MKQMRWSVLIFLMAAGSVPGQYERTYQSKTLEQWTKQLHDPLLKNRLAAVSALGTIGPDGVSGLGMALQDQDAKVRLEAARALVKLHRRNEAGPVLRALLKEADLNVRFPAAVSLAGFGEQGMPAVPILIEILESTKTPLHSAALTSLGRLGPLAKEANPALLRLLSDKNPTTRFNASNTLAKVNPQGGEIVPALLQALGDPQTADHASYTLRQIGKPAVADLTKALKDPKVPYFEVRNILINVQGKDALPLMREALQRIDDTNSTTFGESRSQPVIYPLLALGEDGLPLLHDALKQRNGPWTNELLSTLHTIALSDGNKDISKKHASAVLALVLKESAKHYAAYAVQKLGMLGSPAVPTLIEALKHQEWEVRQKAADALHGLGTRASAAVPALLHALQHDTDADVRASAAVALGQLDRQNPAVLASLLTAVKDKDQAVRNKAEVVLLRMGVIAKDALPALIQRLQDGEKDHWWTAKILSQLGPLAKDALPALRAALPKETPYARLAIALALWKIGEESKEGTPVILAGLQEKDGSLRGYAVQCAGEFLGGVKDTAPLLFDLARTDKDAKVRKEAEDSLVRLGKHALPFLVESLKDANVLKKTAALTILSRMGTSAQEATPALLTALQDPNGNVRVWGAHGLGTVHAPAKVALPALKQALTDKFPQVRQWAIRSLENYGLEGMQLTLPGLEDVDATVRAQAFAALGKLGPRAKDSVPVLLRLLKNKKFAARTQVISVLGKIGPDAHEAIPLLVETVEQTPTQRLLALQALRDMEPPAEKVVPAALKAIEDKDAKVRRTAARLLGDLGKEGVVVLGQALNKQTGRIEVVEVLAQLGSAAKEALPGLLEALTDWSPEVRHQATIALGRIGPAAQKALPALRHYWSAEKYDPQKEARSPEAALARYRISGDIQEALPTLLSHLEKENHDAARVLLELGPEAKKALPTLRQRLHEGTHSQGSRFMIACAVLRFGGEDREALDFLLDFLPGHQGGGPEPRLDGFQEEAMGKAGVAAKEVLPELRRLKAFIAVARITNDWGETLPLLAQYIKENYRAQEAVKILSELGPQAKNIAPVLREALLSPLGEVRRNARLALKKIDP